MKLSLYQQRVSSGERTIPLFNDNELYNRIFDVKLENTVNLNTVGDTTLHLVSVSEKGCLVYSLRKVPGRAGDYNAFILGVPTSPPL